MIYSVNTAVGTAGLGLSAHGPVSAAHQGIAVRSVRKAFGDRLVLDGVDLTVQPGTILGLLGPNGAGKTTLIGIMVGLLATDSGEVSIDGLDVRTQRAELGRRIGLAPQRLGIYPTLSVIQNLRCAGEIGGLDRRRASARAAELIALFGLEPQTSQRAGRLSGGQQRRLHTAIALMHDPAVLFLDEPTVGADVASRGAILAVIARLAEQGQTIVYTTHYLNELEQLDGRRPCEIAVLHEGRIRARGSLREIVARHAAPSLDVRLAHADLESAYLAITGAQP